MSYNGLRLFNSSLTRGYNDVSLAAQGGGGQTTVGLLNANYDGKSFGVFGQGGGTFTVPDTTKGWARTKTASNYLMFTVQFNNTAATTTAPFTV